MGKNNQDSKKAKAASRLTKTILIVFILLMNFGIADAIGIVAHHVYKHDYSVDLSSLSFNALTSYSNIIATYGPNHTIEVPYGSNDSYVSMYVIKSDRDKNRINDFNSSSNYDDNNIFDENIFATLFYSLHSSGVNYLTDDEVTSFDNLDVGTPNYTAFSLVRPEDGYFYTKDMFFSPVFTEIPYVCGGCVALALTLRLNFDVAPAPVPEPSTILLMTLGLLGLLSVRFRKKH